MAQQRLQAGNKTSENSRQPLLKEGTAMFATEI